MSIKSVIIILIVIAVLAIIGLLLFLIFKFQSDNDISFKEGDSTDTSDEIPTLQALLNIVSKKESSKEELFSALKIFTNNFTIPTKNGIKIPDEAKAHLSFVLLLSSHKNADAKLIAFMSNELKKKNPQYESEIELYEEQGRLRRKG